MEAILAAPAKMGEDDGDGDRLAAIAAIERVERASGNRTMIDGGHCGRGRGEGRTEEERRRQQWVLVVVKFGVLQYIYEVLRCFWY